MLRPSGKTSRRPHPRQSRNKVDDGLRRLPAHMRTTSQPTESGASATWAGASMSVAELAQVPLLPASQSSTSGQACRREELHFHTFWMLKASPKAQNCMRKMGKSNDFKSLQVSPSRPDRLPQTADLPETPSFLENVPGHSFSLMGEKEQSRTVDGKTTSRDRRCTLSKEIPPLGVRVGIESVLYQALT